MKRTKALRRRCDLPACGKLYRHSDPRSRTCSAPCRLRLYRARKKAAAQVAQSYIAFWSEVIFRTFSDCETCRFGIWRLRPLACAGPAVVASDAESPPTAGPTARAIRPASGP